MHPDTTRLLDALAALEHGLLDMTGNLAPWPPGRTWWGDLQADVVAAAQAGPPDADALARGLWDAIGAQPVVGPLHPNPIQPATAELLLAQLDTDLVAARPAAVPPQMPRMSTTGNRHMDALLFTLPGDRGARWLDIICRTAPLQADGLYQDMAAGHLPQWSQADWAARLDVLAALPPDPRPDILTVLFANTPPDDAATSRALCRLATAHFSDQSDHLLRTVAGWIGAHLDGGQADLQRIDWDLASSRPRALAWLLELAGPPGTRSRLVEGGRAQGLAAATALDRVATDLDRPEWADGDVPWTMVRIVRAGMLRTSDGRLCGGDPWSAAEPPIAWTLPVPPGEYPVDVAVVAHPLAVHDDHAAARLTLDPDTPPQSWRPVPSADPHAEGYVVEVGVGAFGTPAPFADRDLFDPDRNPAQPGTAPMPWTATWASGTGDTMVMFTVGEQHQDCRTWTGLDADGHVVVVLTDLGPLDLDPTVDPDRVDVVFTGRSPSPQT